MAKLTTIEVRKIVHRQLKAYAKAEGKSLKRLVDEIFTHILAPKQANQKSV